MKTSRKAQGWSIDFIFALVIFLLSIILTMKFIVSATTDDSFDDLFSESKFISDQLRSEGYPYNWTNDSFVKIGLLTNGKFDDYKFNNFTLFGYSNSKRFLNTRFEYFLMIEDSYGKYLNISSNCGYGSSSIPLLSNPLNPAYYYADLSERVMLDVMQASPYFATTYDGNTPGSGIDELLTAMVNDEHNVVVMENPKLNQLTTRTESEVVEIIQNWTAEGNFLILTQSVYVKNQTLLGMNFSPEILNSSGDATANSRNFFNLTLTDDIEFEDKSTFIVDAVSNYEILANYSNDPAIASWTYGNGRVAYFSDFNLSSNYDGEDTLKDWVEEGIHDMVFAYCGGVDDLALDFDNLVKLERIVPRNSGIAKINVYVWGIEDE